MSYNLNDKNGSIPNLVSVIIPSYNHEKYIIKAVTSVLEQSYKEIELIVIDDGSKDNSVNMLKEIQDSRFKLIVQDNQGAHVAINRGLELAKGEMLTILNSDDIYHPMRIEKILKYLKNEDVDFVSTWIEVIDSEDNLLGIKKGWNNMEPWSIENPDFSYKVTNNFNLNLLMWNFVSTTSNIVMKRSLYEKVGKMRNLRFVHDWDFLLRASSIGNPFLLQEPLLKYRIHNTNTISTNRKWMLFEICWVIAANIHRYERKFILQSSDSEDIIKEINMLYESINFQGNDKLFWIIRCFIEAQKSKGIENPEEILIENENLRDSLINLVKENYIKNNQGDRNNISIIKRIIKYFIEKLKMLI